MNTDTNPFCVCLKKNEQALAGYALQETEWAFTMLWMTSANENEGRRVTIPWLNIDHIEEADIADAPWNKPPDESVTVRRDGP